MVKSLRRAFPYLLMIVGCVVIGLFCRLPGWILTIGTVVLTVAVIATSELMDRYDRAKGDG